MSEVTAAPSAPAPQTTAPAANNKSTETTQAVDTKAQATPAEIKEMKEKFKLTVDGEEFEEEIDLGNKEELKKRFQLGAAAKKRMAEAVSEKRKAFEIIKAFEDNPESMLSRLGPKGREIAEKFLLSQIKDDMLSPEEKEYKATKAELEKYKQQEAKFKEFEQKSAIEKKEAQYAESFQSTIIKAIEQSGLPRSPELVKRMAKAMHKNLEFGLELTPDDLVAEVKTEMTDIVRSIISDADGDALISLLGKDVANKIRKADIKKIQDKQAMVFQGGQKRSSSETSKVDDSRPMSIEEWKESVNRRITQK